MAKRLASHHDPKYSFNPAAGRIGSRDFEPSTNMKTTRRCFLWNCGLLAGAAVAMPAALGQAGGKRKRIAFLGTEVRTHSHSQHFLDRLALGYGWRGGWQEPRTDVASVYIDQFPENGRKS